MKLKATLDSGLTVADLIARLEGADPEAPVVFVCDYGDYAKTKQALPVRQVDDAAYGDFHRSAYSQSGIALSDDGEDDGPRVDEDGQEIMYDCEQVVVLTL